MDLTCAVHWAWNTPLPHPGTEVFAVVSASFPAPLDVDLKPATQEFQVALEGRKRDLQFPEKFLTGNYLSDLQHLLDPEHTFRLAQRNGHYIPPPRCQRSEERRVGKEGR